MTRLKIVDWSALDTARRTELLQRPALADDSDVQATAADVIARVRRDGDAALHALHSEFGGAPLADFAVAAAELEAAGERLTAAQRAAIEAAAANIEEFHAAQMPVDIEFYTSAGVRCERVTRPIGRVGLRSAARSSQKAADAAELLDRCHAPCSA